jgi:hypothetical protein
LLRLATQLTSKRGVHLCGNRDLMTFMQLS